MHWLLGKRGRAKDDTPRTGDNASRTSDNTDSAPETAPRAPRPGDSAPIIIVSGLPRSGTSLMMQMLHAGGLPILSDDQRPPDANNPRGYFEFAPVKRLASEGAPWMESAQGYGLKVVSPLLTYLPPMYHYAVIFMQRDLDEIVRSQRSMLARLGQDAAAFDAAKAHAEYTQHLAAVRLWLNRQPRVQVLEVAYRAVIDSPQETAERVSRFVGRLDVNAMAAVVDPSLYRERG